MAVFVRNISARAQVMDGEALLSPPVLEHIVGAVLAAIEARKVDEHSRARDTRIAGACCDGCASGEAGA
jgi:hypothetical protein